VESEAGKDGSATVLFRIEAMDRTNLNLSIMNQVGVMLLPNERLEVAVELESGLTEDLERRHTTLLLTSKRLMRYSSGGQRVNVISVGLEDVDSIEVNRSDRRRQWIAVGVVFIAGGLLLGLLSLLLLASPLSPLLMAVSLSLIGIVFMLTYVGERMGNVVIRAGVKAIKCKMCRQALDDMAIFVHRFYELRLGLPGDRVALGDPLQASDGIAAGRDVMATGSVSSEPNS
jgi:hypothetical protein